MKNDWGIRIGGLFITVLLVALIIAGSGQAAPASRPLNAELGTNFTYQGYLEDGGVPANGEYYMTFKLFNLASAGGQMGSTITLWNVLVTDGYFTVELDFGESVWSGWERWLEIGVWDKLGGLPDVETLSPRQPLTPVPYALYAKYADSVPFDGDGTAETASRSDHTHFGASWQDNGTVGLRVVNTGTFADSVALSGVAQGASGVTYGVFGQADSPQGFAGYFNNASSGGTAIYATGEGSDRDEATLQVFNTEPVDGIAGFMSNESGYETLHLRNEGLGGVLHLQNAGSGIGGAGGGDFIVATNNDFSDVQFKVTTSGAVYTDEGYNCGRSINDTPLLPAFTTLGQNESSLDSCLKDDAPADFAEMLPGQIEINVGDVVVVTPGGSLALSKEAYQSTVVGVHSYRPSYLGNAQFADDEGYIPLAMMGVVPVKVSAENGAITPGDLLVASDSPGHAMRAGENPPQGTVIGKALSPLEADTGFIQMIVTLQ